MLFLQYLALPAILLAEMFIPVMMPIQIAIVMADMNMDAVSIMPVADIHGQQYVPVSFIASLHAAHLALVLQTPAQEAVAQMAVEGHAQEQKALAALLLRR